ncbi:MAG: acyl-CoA thioesterase [Flavobacteriales bacterium]|nr:acyl-CoA thioesterase [Flavobacteriales bacterium]
MEVRFAQRIEVPVAWGEQDLFGHVNNIVYFRWFESVRMHFLERIGALRSHAEQGVGVILATTTCDFQRPVHWPQRLTVETGPTHIGNTSFTLAYRITDEAGLTVAEGTSVQVMYDYNAGHKVPIPAPIRAAITALQHP